MLTAKKKKKKQQKKTWLQQAFCSFLSLTHFFLFCTRSFLSLAVFLFSLTHIGPERATRTHIAPKQNTKKAKKFHARAKENRTQEKKKKAQSSLFVGQFT
jgi:hypothetical protein